MRRQPLWQRGWQGLLISTVFLIGSWATDARGQNVFPANGNVGIGTVAPATGLSIERDLGEGGPFISLSYVSGSGAAYYGGLQWLNGLGAKGWAIENNTLVGNDYLEFNKGSSSKMVLDPNGNVGIGTASPGAALSITRDFGEGGPFISLSYISGSGAAYYGGLQWLNGLGAKGWAIENNTLVGNDYLEFNKGSSSKMVLDPNGNVGIGTTSPAARFHVNGNAQVDGNIAAKYQDVAEWVPAAERILPGIVVIIDPTGPNRVIPAFAAYDTRVAGVVSERPGLLLGEAGDDKAKVAHSGRVRVKVDAAYGSIAVGDLLVASPTPGHAMRSKPFDIGGATIHRPGTLLGKALEPLADGQGEILVLLTLQ